MKFNSAKLKTAGFIMLALYCFAFSGLITSGWLKCLMGTIGCGCIPVFCLLIDEAYKKTSNLSKLMLKGLLMAFICAFPYRYAFASQANLNSFKSFFSAALTSFCLTGSVMLYDKMKEKWLRYICIGFICAMSLIIGCDFAPYAFIIMFIIHIYRDKKFIFTAYYVSAFVIVISAVSLFFLFFTDYSQKASGDELIRNICLSGSIIGLPIIKNYDGTRGPDNKALRLLSYIVYPVILGVIVLIKVIK